MPSPDTATTFLRNNKTLIEPLELFGENGLIITRAMGGNGHTSREIFFGTDWLNEPLRLSFVAIYVSEKFN